MQTSCPDTPGTLDSSFSTVGEADENYQPNTTVTPTPFDCGAQRKVTWTCLAGHSGTWRSSPEVRGMAEVNLLAAAAVQFRGGTYTELSDWCKTMNVQMIAETTFYEMQKAYLHPAIEDLYQEYRKKSWPECTYTVKNKKLSKLKIARQLTAINF